MAELLLGIDVGTTGTKLVLIDLRGSILAEVVAPCSLRSPHATWAEADPREWWDNVGRLVPRALERAAAQPGDVVGIGCSGALPALVLLDEQGEPLRPSIQQSDARAVDEIEYFKSQVDEDAILRRTGSGITQQSIGPKLRWLVRHEPEVMRRARRVVGSYDFVAARLSGARVLERNWSLESGLFDMQREDWDDQLVALAGISRDLLAPVRWPAELAGPLTRDAARHTGLLEGTPVVTGSADHIASAFSAGVKREGDLLVKLGGSGDILYALDRPMVDQRLYLDYHLIPGKYILNGCMACSGSLIKWFRDEFGGGLDYAELDREAAPLSPGSDGLVLLPYFLGEKTPLNDPLARGVVVGLTLSHTRAHLYRAVLEGIAYGFAHHQRVLAELGCTFDRARVTNGGARSELWPQVTADVLGIPLERIAHHPGSSLGATFVAGMGVGAFADWGEIERYLTVEHVTQPDPEAHERYQQLVELYLDLYPTLQPTFSRLARL